MVHDDTRLYGIENETWPMRHELEPSGALCTKYQTFIFIIAGNNKDSIYHDDQFKITVAS